MAPASADGAADAVADVVRTSYGRLVALLAASTRDLAAAEDALAEALEAALRTWPDRGVPDRPEAWMLTAARRALIGAHRRRDVAARAAPTLAVLAEELAEPAASSAVPDKRLELMYVCAHPAIDPSVHTALMLQAVLGLDAVRIASAFLVRPEALGQRLVRAKRRITSTGIAFELPSAEQLPQRTAAVLDAVYAAYGTGWDDATGADPKRRGLTAEAIRLATILVELQPHEPEAHGLLALLLHSDARRDARRAPDGSFVPLAEQDVARWSRPTVERAEHHLSVALSLGRVGPYQLHAAIQSVHNRRAATGTTDWGAIAALYAGLAALDPSVGTRVARAAAVMEAAGATEAASLLDAMDDADDADVATYQPYWVLRAELAARTGADPSEPLARAVELTSETAVRAHLEGRFGHHILP